jgi:hypothetical protein
MRCIARGDERLLVLRSLLVGLLALGLVATSFADQASANRRRRGSSRGRSYNRTAIMNAQRQATINAANAQIAAAKQVLAAAETTGGNYQARLDAALAKLTDSAARFHEAQSTTRHLAKDLAEIENEIIEDQAADSPYAKAGLALDAARQKLQAVEQAILAEPDVKLQLSGLSAEKRAERQATLLSFRADYLLAKNALEAAGSEHDRIRRELFREDADWKAAAEALTEARNEEKAAEEKTHSGASGRVGDSQKVRNATEAAAAARTAIARAEAVLRSVGNGNNNNNNNRNANSRSNSTSQKNGNKNNNKNKKN